MKTLNRQRIRRQDSRKILSCLRFTFDSLTVRQEIRERLYQKALFKKRCMVVPKLLKCKVFKKLSSHCWRSSLQRTERASSSFFSSFLIITPCAQPRALWFPPPDRGDSPPTPAPCRRNHPPRRTFPAVRFRLRLRPHRRPPPPARRST